STGHTACIMLFGRVGEKLDGDPQYQQPADELDEADLQELRGEKGQRHAQQDRRTRAEHDAAHALRFGQRAHRQRDHHGVIARQNQIDQNDAESTKNECEVQASVYPPQVRAIIVCIVRPLTFCVLSCLIDTARAQTRPAPPAYQELRFDENWRYLRDTPRSDFWAPVKYIGLGPSGWYTSIGGEAHRRYAFFR